MAKNERRYIKQGTQTEEDKALVRAKKFEESAQKMVDDMDEEQRQRFLENNSGILAKFLPQVKTTDEDIQASHISLLRSFDLLPDQDDLSRRCTILESQVRRMESELNVEKEFSQKTIVYLRSRFRFTINKIKKLHPEEFKQVTELASTEETAIANLESWSKWLFSLQCLFRRIIREHKDYALQANGYPITPEEIESECRRILGDEFWEKHYGKEKEDEQQTKETD